ncbi:hypothetical protein [Streptomyces sp. NBC_00273]|uniref:hypothetical protein n=1 Tax=Streptomyces sp. NBC_00273 TaxID=2903644 RepID=UPI002E2B5657|nr:hypothetical protein [Streptomyces sp. NBC_00273]
MRHPVRAAGSGGAWNTPTGCAVRSSRRPPGWGRRADWSRSFAETLTADRLGSEPIYDTLRRRMLERAGREGVP